MQDIRSLLLATTDKWCSVQDPRAPRGRLSKAVAKDFNFFERVEASDTLPCNFRTLKNFARYLSDGTNWPDGRVPQVALDFAHVVGVSADEAAMSAGKADELSATRGRAAA